MRVPRLFLYQLLNQKKIGWLVIAIATAGKSVLAAFFSNYEADKSFYLLLSKNIGAGKGFTIPVSLLSDPSVTENIYLPSAITPLYSLVAAPLLQLFPDNYFLVTWIIESLSWLLFFIVLRKLLFRLTQDHYWTNLFILFSGFFIYGVELSSSFKDVPAVAFLFLALGRCIYIGQSATRLSWGYLALTAFLFLVPGLIKSTYLPFAIIFPLSLLLIALLKKEKQLLRHAAATFCLSVVLLSSFYFYSHFLEQQAVSRHADFFSGRWSMVKNNGDFMAGFFPENLWQLYPFIPASIVNLDLLGVQVQAHFYPVYNVYAVLLHTMNFLGVAVFIVGFFYLLKKYYGNPVSRRIFFLLAGMFSSLSMLALLSFMSLTYPPVEYKGSYSSWTFVYESRSFLFLIVFLQLCLFVFLFAKKQTVVFFQRLRTFFLIIAGLSFFHGVYFVLKKTTRLGHPQEKAISVNKRITGEAESLQKANPGYTVWLATEIQHLDWYAKLQHQKVLNNVAFLNDSSFRLPPKTILLTAIAKEDIPAISSYLHKPGVKEYRNYNDLYFIFRQDAP